MEPPDPHESAGFAGSEAARRRLLESGANELPRFPWQPTKAAPDDVTLLRFAMWQANKHVGDASPDDLRAALKLLASARSDLDALEAGLVLIARAEGLTWTDIADQLGVKSPQAAQQRFQRVSTRVEDSDDSAEAQ